MAPKAPKNQISAAEGPEERSFSPQERSVSPPPPVTHLPSPSTQVNLPTRPQTRANTAQPEPRTPQNVAESILTLPARPEDQQATKEKSRTPADNEPKQKRQPREPGKTMDRTIASGITKGGPKSRKSANGIQARGSTAGSGHKTTLLQKNLAAMLEYLKKEEREAATMVDQAYTAVEEAAAAKKEAMTAVAEAVTTGEEVKMTLERVKRTALENNEKALATMEQALREKKEAIETKEEALKISERFGEEKVQ